MSSSVITDRFANVRAWLAKPRANVWIVAIAMVLTSTSLWAGLAADDFMQAIVLRKIALPRAMSGPFDLFRFADGNPATSRALMDIGQFPWTADPQTRFAFFRPLAAATHVLDYALWPSSSALMHAQSMAWFALALFAVAAFYRRFVEPGWLAGFALLLYAIDDTHGPTVGWLANRNSIIALALSLPVLLLHDRGRRTSSFRVNLFAAALLASALLAGESAVAVLAYVAAYTLHLDRAAWHKRLISILPYSVVLFAWRVLYTRLGYGVAGSGLYLDPSERPIEFLTAVPRRLPFLLLGELGAPRSDAGETYEFMGTHATAWMVAYAVLCLALVSAVVAPIWRRDPVTRFFVTGMLLSVLPICAAFTSDRLLLFVGLGAIGIIAKLVMHATTFSARLVSSYLLLIHLAFAPLLLLVRSRYNDYQLWITLADETISKSEDIASKTVVLINPPNDLFYIYIPVLRATEGVPRPARLRGLANVMDEVEVARVDDFTLRVRPKYGFLEHESERMMVDERRPFSLGSRVDIPGMTVTVTGLLPDRHPAEAVFRFDKPLEDSSFVWMRWDRFGYVPWTPPHLGEVTRVPARDFRSFVLDLEARVAGVTR